MNLETFTKIYDVDLNNIEEKFKTDKLLEFYYFLNNKNTKKIEINTNFENNALFIYFDNKPHFKNLLYLSIKNLGENWSHTVICCDENFNEIQNYCLELSDKINIMKVNKNTYFLLEMDFWKKIESNNILIYNEDIFFVKELENKYFSYDIINHKYIVFIKKNIILNILNKSKLCHIQNMKKNKILIFSIFLDKFIEKVKMKNVYNPIIESDFCSMKYNQNCFSYFSIWLKNKNYVNIINSNNYLLNKKEKLKIILLSGKLNDEIYENFYVFKNLENMNFIPNENYLFVNGNFEIKKNDLIYLEKQMEKSYCYIMSPLIIENNQLIYFGGVLNKNNYFYINQNILSLKNINHFCYSYNQNTMIPYLQLFIIKNKNDILKNINVNNFKNKILNICIKLKEIKVSPFVKINCLNDNENFEKTHNIEYDNHLNFEFNNENLKEIYNMYNNNSLVSFKFLNDFYYLSLSKKKYILFIEYCKFSPDKDCGSLYIYYLMKTLLNMGYNVHFYNVLSDGNYNKILQEMGIFVFDKDLKFKNIVNNYNVYDFIFISRTFSMNYFFNDIKKYCIGTKIIFVTHDIHLLKNKKQLSLGQNISRNPKGEDEIKYINNSDISLIVSNYEYDYLLNKEKLNKIHYAPICYEIENDYCREIEKTKDIYFIGSGYNANVDALKFFLENHWNYIVERLENIKCHIIGFGLNNLKLKYKQNSSIVFHGYVPNDKLNNILKNCRINIVPLRYGGGIKGKILQSLNLKIPCIASKVAVEGMEVIDKEHIIVEYFDNNFPEKFEKYYNNIELLKKISENGYKLMKEKYSLQKNEEYLNDMFLKIQ